MTAKIIIKFGNRDPVAQKADHYDHNVGIYLDIIKHLPCK